MNGTRKAQNISNGKAAQSEGENGKTPARVCASMRRMTDAAQWPPPTGRQGDDPDSAGQKKSPPVPPPIPPVTSIPAAGIVPPVFSAPVGSPGAGQPFADTASPRWTPPPRHGLVPLRPLSFSTLLGASFQLLRRSPRTTLGVALVLQGLGTVLSVAIYGAIVLLAAGRVSQAAPADRNAVEAGSIALAVVAGLIPLAVSLTTGVVVQGVVVLEVSRGVLGQRPTLPNLLSRLRGRFGALIGWTLLQALGVILLALTAVAMATPLFILTIQGAGTGTLITGILLLIVAALAATTIGVWLSTKLALVPSLLVIERLPLGHAVARSWQLVAGSFWRTFGALALMTVIIQTASQVLATPITLLVPIGSALIAPTDQNARAVISAVVMLLSMAVGLVIGAAGTVLDSALSGLLYLDRRMRREGFDLVLLRYVEDHAAGRSPADPFPAPERS